MQQAHALEGAKGLVCLGGLAERRGGPRRAAEDETLQGRRGRTGH